MKRQKSSSVSDLFCLIGTVFLWLYWPSFVAGTIEPGTDKAEIALVNTVLALIGSTVAVFIVSPLLTDNMIRAVDVQNATLAGGVTIGATAALAMHPCLAVLIGFGAGVLSTVGFCRIQEWLDDHFG